jgi:hypothetical protein
VSDEALVAAILEAGGDEICTYCSEEPALSAASAPIELVLELLVDGLRHEYEDPSEQVAYESAGGGYLLPVYDTRDLIYDLDVSERTDVLEDVIGAIRQGLWCQRDPYAATPTQALKWGWEGFREFVKHRRRYTFLVHDDSTTDGAGAIPMHSVPASVAEAVSAAGLTKTLAATSQWWRARVHAPGLTYSSAADIGTPPDAVARDNRMTPKGIGAFYGASTSAGARAEVAGYAQSGDEASLGRFATTAPLVVVDLRELPAVPSLFDPNRRHLRPPIRFLYDFVADVTKIADPSDVQNLDYVPTQVVAEYFRHKLTGATGPVNGLLWRSSKDSSVTVCVLFVPSSEVADLGAETPKTRLVLDPSTVHHIYAPL